jgi:hypothetical protein
MNKKILIAVALVSPMIAGTAHATNLVVNGNFSTGDFTGWTVGGNNTGYPPAVVATNAACCFGETVPNDPLTVGSPDLGDGHAVYFVDDFANQTLTQSVFLPVGNYAIGFDAFIPSNGYGNPGNANFTATIAGINLATMSVKGEPVGDVATWLNFSGVADVLTAGDYMVSFDFNTTDYPQGPPEASADVLIDRVFVATTTDTGGIPVGSTGVPEPATLALFAVGLAGLSRIRRRK